MSDYYIRIPTEEAFDEMEGQVPFIYGQGGELFSPGWAIDVIGDLYKITSWNRKGEPTYTQFDGFFINLRSDFPLPEFLREFEVFPKTPERVWA